MYFNALFHSKVVLCPQFSKQHFFGVTVFFKLQAFVKETKQRKCSPSQSFGWIVKKYLNQAETVIFLLSSQ